MLQESDIFLTIKSFLLSRQSFKLLLNINTLVQPQVSIHLSTYSHGAWTIAKLCISFEFLASTRCRLVGHFFFKLV